MHDQTVPPGSTPNSYAGTTNRLPQLVATYLQWQRVEGYTEATRRGYRVEIGLFVRFLEAHGHSLAAADVSPGDILNHLNDLKDRGARPRTIKGRWLRIRAFFEWAVSWELVVSNPALKYRPPKVPKTPKRFLSVEAWNKLLAICPLNTFTGARRQSMLWLLATTGLRRRELFSLSLGDLDWERGAIRIWQGKGQKYRVVPFVQQTQRTVFRYLSYRTDPLECLWVTEERSALTYLGIGQDLKRLMQRAGVKSEFEDVCHVFRRTFAAGAVRQRLVRPYIQAVGGWARPEMIDLYTAWMGQEQEAALEAFQDFNPFSQVKTEPRQ